MRIPRETCMNAFRLYPCWLRGKQLDLPGTRLLRRSILTFVICALVGCGGHEPGSVQATGGDVYSYCESIYDAAERRIGIDNFKETDAYVMAETAEHFRITEGEAKRLYLQESTKRFGLDTDG